MVVVVIIIVIVVVIVIIIIVIVLAGVELSKVQLNFELKLNSCSPYPFLSSLTSWRLLTER